MEEVYSEISEGMCLITINRPERRNARDRAANRRIAEIILDADYDSSIRLVAIRGVGRDAFSAGADLKEAKALAESGRVYGGPLHRPERSLFEIMIDSKKPLMAIINGPAVAGGFELALACDLRVAADHAHFAMVEAKRGRGAHFGSVLLPTLVPQAIAMEWLYTGRKINVQEAERWGLLNRVVPYADLMATANALAADVISSAPLSLQRLKATYRKTHGMPLHSALRLDAGPDAYASKDQREGIAAFLEKRQPKWTNQ